MDGSGGSRDGGRDIARWTVGELTGEKKKGLGLVIAAADVAVRD